MWPTIKKKLELLGHMFFYLTLKFFGQRCAYIILNPVIFCYIIFSRKIHTVTSIYLKKRFPEHTQYQYFLDTYKNVLSFGQVLIDRVWLSINPRADIEWNVIGKDKLLDIIAAGKGAVLVTGHVGNWQTALAKLNSLPVKVHALMQKDQLAAAKHFFDLIPKDQSFDVIDVEGPFGGMIEATAALQRGEIVTIMADRHIKGTAKAVDFLGEEIRLPDAAYGLAACVGTPVVVFLAAKTNRRVFELQVWDIFYPKFTDRDKRDEMLQQCSQKFATVLQNYLQIYPYQWYNFFDIWDQADQKSFPERN